MHDLGVLRDLALIVGLAIPVVALTHRMRLPSLIGFLFVGIAIGPGGLGLIPEPDTVSTLAEIGVVLLLFEIGLELSLSQVLQWRVSVVVSGSLQLFGTVALVTGIGVTGGLPMGRSVFYGALVALSSTAIVSRTLSERGELDTPHGREVMAVLLFQDLAIAPLMLLLSVLAQPDGVTGSGEWGRLSSGLVAMTGLLVGGRFVVRWTLDRVVETRDRELFTLCVAFFAIGTALGAGWAGFSLAVGAFLAGLIISESEYGLQALSDVLPFRALFSGVFLTSIGMLLDLSIVMEEMWTLLGATAGVVLVKTVVAGAAVGTRGRSVKVSVASGLSLAQLGEFSFVLAAAGVPLGLFAVRDYQLFLGTAALSMVAAPFLIRGARAAGGRVAAILSLSQDRSSPPVAEMTDHAVVVGYGLAGRYLARMLRVAGIDCVVIDQNVELVRLARRDGLVALFGDGARHAMLRHAGADAARLLVFAISSPLEERRGVAVAREVAPAAAIVVRTRYVQAIDDLMRMGANEVVVEEFEASLELFARALESYEIPASRIAHELDAVRAEHYGLLRGRAQPDLHLDTLKHLGIHSALELAEVEQDAVAVGESATSLNLRRTTGAVQIAVIRAGEAHYQRETDFFYEVGDTAVLVGDRDALDRAAELFRRH